MTIFPLRADTVFDLGKSSNRFPTEAGNSQQIWRGLNFKTILLSLYTSCAFPFSLRLILRFTTPPTTRRSNLRTNQTCRGSVTCWTCWTPFLRSTIARGNVSDQKMPKVTQFKVLNKLWPLASSFNEVSYRYTAKQRPSTSDSNYSLACKIVKLVGVTNICFDIIYRGSKYSSNLGWNKWSSWSAAQCCTCHIKRVWFKIRPTAGLTLWSQTVIWAHEVSSKLLHRLSWDTKVSKATWDPPALAGAQSAVRWPAGAIRKE